MQRHARYYFGRHCFRCRSGAENGQPIILAADRQTTGGYAKPITVITADLPLLAQAKPGNTIRFKPVSLAEAEAAAKEEQRFFEDLRF